MKQTKTVREAVAVFDDLDKLQEAVNDLETAGFDRRHISVLGSEKAVSEKFGTEHPFMRAIEDSPEAPRAPAVKLEELGVAQGILVGSGLLAGVFAGVLASGGMALPGAMVTTLLIGAGGTAAGAGLAKLLGDEYAEFFDKQIEAGGLLLWVSTPDKDMEDKAVTILKAQGGSDVHVHDVQADTFEHVPADGTLLPQQSGEAFVRLDEVAKAHETLLNEDNMAAHKLSKPLNRLKRAAEQSEALAQEEARSVAGDVEDAAAYAQDMGEEEQRIIAESHAAAAGNEEAEAQRYLALARDLKAFVSDYHKRIDRAA